MINYEKMRGQLTAISVVMIFVVIIMIGALLPSVISTINNTISGGQVTPLTSSTLQLIPAFMVLMVLLSIVIMATTRREQQNV